MNIWATVDFGKVKITQAWKFLADEIGEDSEPHDFLLVFVTEKQKPIVIQLEQQFVLSRDAERCYLGTLHISEAVKLP